MSQQTCTQKSYRQLPSGVGAGDAAASSSKFFKQIWAKIWKILDKLGKI